MNHFRKEEDPMEKYEKPVMVVEEIVEEIHTKAVYPDPVPNTTLVSGDYNGRTNNTQTLVPGTTYVP